MQGILTPHKPKFTHHLIIPFGQIIKNGYLSLNVRSIVIKKTTITLYLQCLLAYNFTVTAVL